MPEVKCPNGHKLNVPDEYLGKEVRCAVCDATFVAPQLEAPAPASQPAPPSPAAAWAPEPTETAAGPSPEPAGGAAEQPAISVDSPVSQQRAPRRSFWSDFGGVQVGKPMLFGGLILVVLARGCDGLGIRMVGRLRAKASSASGRFDQQTARMVRDKDPNEANKIRNERSKQRSKLMSGDWSNLADAATNAGANHTMWSYFYQWLFLLGSITLTLGLLIVGFHGSGAERTICLIMIAIVTFSIYIGGMAWIEAVTTSMSGLLPGR